MDTSPQIRLAIPADAPAVARLSAQLGYPSSEDLTRVRLQGLLSSSNHRVIVADVAGAAVGWATAEIRRSLESDPRVELTGLVVAATSRRGGVGRRLVEDIERWAVERGCRELFLRSNVVRQEAHPFYERLGYEHVKTQRAYRKVLSQAWIKP
ncbi:MAG: GNAT family N-acetyltransferase [Gammaproteobacteria bacterium]|nr:GNAT family N-acetyltransferase [Gammaproteobacteria bacterium]